MAPDDRTLLHVEVGPGQIDVPQSLGHFGGIGVAAALGLLEPPLAAFIAADPVIKVVAECGSPVALRFLAEMLQGAAKPVGSDAQGTVRLADRDREPAGAAPGHPRTAARAAAPAALAGG